MHGNQSSVSWKTAALVLFVGAPAVWHGYLTLARSHEVRKRRKRLEHRQREYATRKLIERSATLKAGDKAEALEQTHEVHSHDASIEAATLNDVADEEERDMLMEAFASWKCLSRWHNALGFEWREQGAWEWLYWKLVWTPLNGKLFDDGGIPKDPAELARTLPVETPNFIALFGFDPTSATCTIPETASYSSPPRSASSQGMSDSWERLSSTSQPFAEESSVSGTPSQAVALSSTALSTKSTENCLTFCWIGQSTTYVQLDGVGILTDPVFAHKTVDVFLAPPRLAPPPCRLKDLMAWLQVVIVSHGHADHIHPADVREIGDSAQWVVPLGLGEFLRKHGVTRITELDWWQGTTLQVSLKGQDMPVELRVHATPAQHWTARTPLDVNKSLWASFVVQGSRQSFFHAGDTGYSDGFFKAIGRIFGGVDVAFLPIGAYEPRWHLAPQHASPADAVKIARDIKAKKAVGVHWRTWQLSSEHYLQPKQDLEIAKRHAGVDDDAFVTVIPGQVVQVKPDEA
ncbi:hypothetical protein OIO90_006076 [Microbotryomycetes sp. JL221]|nr:hypothetical protein OIO90_006076 [Microbotryomycetes sp. JL221]